MDRDVSQELRDTENALRDFIASTLSEKLGPEWVDKCGVSDDRLAKWRERKAVEEKRQEAGVVEERLIYYADFYDLKTILHKHWQHFQPALGDKKELDAFLTILERLRDPDAHRREFLPHQKQLVLGIGGGIRNKLVRYRSKQETIEDYFPRIESARDSLGHIWVPRSRGVGVPQSQYVITEKTLRVGDRLDFVVTATDPLGGPLEYSLSTSDLKLTHWTPEHTFSLVIEKEHIGNNFGVKLRIRSDRDYHAYVIWDDEVGFVYSVLPARK